MVKLKNSVFSFSLTRLRWFWPISKTHQQVTPLPPSGCLCVMLACSTVVSVVLPCLIDAAYIGSLATPEVPESWHFLRKGPKSPSSELHAGYQSPASGLQKHAQSWLLPRIYTVSTSCLTFWENVRLSDRHDRVRQTQSAAPLWH